MFHQANLIPAGDVGDGTQSLLDYWYERVMQEFSNWITFPVKVSHGAPSYKGAALAGDARNPKGPASGLCVFAP